MFFSYTLSIPHPQQPTPQVFNVGEFRRRLGLSGVDKSFFEANNAEAQKTREHMAAQVLDEAYEWLSAAGEDVRGVGLCVGLDLGGGGTGFVCVCVDVCMGW